MAFASRQDAIGHLAEVSVALSETWQDAAGHGAGLWGSEVRRLYFVWVEIVGSNKKIAQLGGSCAKSKFEPFKLAECWPSQLQV